MSVRGGTRPEDLYDYVYSWKDYRTEAEVVRQLLVAEGISEGSSVLEAACGTGRYLEHLQQWFDVSGFDLDPTMLRAARWRVPKGAFFLGDMSTLQVEQSLDVLLCLFGGVGYLSPREQLAAGAAAFHNSLRPGGVALIEPWVEPEEFVAGRSWMQTYVSVNFKLARLVVPRRDGNRCVLDFHYQLARAGHRVEQLHAAEILWLHPLSTLIDVFENVGFEVRLTRQGFMPSKHLLICRRLS
ncbi:MAG: class I SAM-dependent methyltransferase [Myxococcota bacterium]|nr:class I SAM-dependent methyltransferase [Myxococcota bacterium]